MTNDPRVVDVTCPEAVPLRFQIAELPSRVIAFMIDFFIITVTSALVGLAGLLLGGLSGLMQPVALGLVGFFLIRYFYFAFFEIAWHGTTPGKRLLRLRVVSRDGSSLSVDAILTRNLVRDIEVFLPLAVIGAPEAIFGEAPWWVWIPAVTWMLVIALLPALSREHSRAGDLLAGTLVIETPVARLLPDEAARISLAPRNADDAILFTAPQLGIYGEHELETLAELIRKIDEGKAASHDQAVVARAIARKIAYAGHEPNWEPARFLRAFYKQQRAALEKQLLFGKRKARKEPQKP